MMDNSVSKGTIVFDSDPMRRYCHVEIDMHSEYSAFYRELKSNLSFEVILRRLSNFQVQDDIK